jgi:ubiquinone/menaquinone biosynthesis C-methylase UbiE
MDTNPRFHRLEPQSVTLQPITAPGWILDLGGGGEGVIGQLCGERVVAIDRQRQELAEAPGSALKIVMDAKDLQFLDHTFQTATAFFFFMFTPPQIRAEIFKEIYRVLRPGGSLLIWDITIPPYPGEAQDIFVFPLKIVLPDGKEIETGYGCPWPNYHQTVDDYIHTAQAAGFTIKSCQAFSAVFSLELVRD